MNRIRLFIAILFVLAGSFSVQGQTSRSSLSKVNWQKGPTVGDLGGVAQVKIPEGYVFTGGDGTRTVMEMMHNPASGEEVGFVSPTTPNWYLVFEYEDIGYVKDDERNSLDPDKILKSIRKGNDAGNKERKKRGWSTMEIVGWEQQPRYDPATHNLEWAVRGASEGDTVINFNTRLLGRGGVMRVTLVASPEVLQASLPQAKAVLSGFEYTQGHRYAEYKSGDKLAKYGLTALIVGGAGAIAVKTGLFKYLWKILVVGFLAISAFFKKIFSRRQTE